LSCTQKITWNLSILWNAWSLLDHPKDTKCPWQPVCFRFVAPMVRSTPFFWHHGAKLHHSKINVYFSPNKSNLFSPISVFEIWLKAMKVILIIFRRCYSLVRHKLFAPDVFDASLSYWKSYESITSSMLTGEMTGSRIRISKTKLKTWLYMLIVTWILSAILDRRASRCSGRVRTQAICEPQAYIYNEGWDICNWDGVLSKHCYRHGLHSLRLQHPKKVGCCISKTTTVSPIRSIDPIQATDRSHWACIDRVKQLM